MIADTFAGRVHVEWEKGEGAAMTPLGQLPFFIEYLKQGGLFDGWVAGCPLSLTSPNAPLKRDILGTVMLSVLAGHRRYAHITALCCDPVNPPLLGMTKWSARTRFVGHCARSRPKPGEPGCRNSSTIALGRCCANPGFLMSTRR